MRDGNRARGSKLVIVMTTCAWALACGGGDQPQSTAPAMQQAPANSEEPGVNQPPKVERLELEPKPLRPGQVARATATASDPDGGSPQILFAWHADGKHLEGQTRSTLPTEGMRRGTVLEVTAKAYDGALASEEVKVRTRLGNTPPEVRSVVIGPAGVVRPNEVVEAIVESEDSDGDSIELTYRWFVNGKERATKSKFSTKGLRRDDRVEVEVTPHDGTDLGKARRSQTLKLVNSPPVFMTRGVPQPKRTGDLFVYEFEAKDPDGDRTLRWELLEGPAGMSIDSILGTLTWQPDRKEVGKHPVEIRVSDPHGDSTAMRFHLEVTEEVETSPASPGN